MKNNKYIIPLLGAVIFLLGFFLSVFFEIKELSVTERLLGGLYLLPLAMLVGYLYSLLMFIMIDKMLVKINKNYLLSKNQNKYIVFFFSLLIGIIFYYSGGFFFISLSLFLSLVYNYALKEVVEKNIFKN